MTVTTPANRLFLSYSSRDTDRVHAVAEGLREAGLGVWIDQQDVGPGDDIVRRIDEGLQSSKYFVMFVSKSYLESEWTQAEYSAAFFAATNSNERQVLVVRLDDEDLPPLVGGRRYITWTTQEEVVRGIERWVGGLERARPELVPARTKKVRWDDVQDSYLSVITSALLDRRHEVIASPSATTPIDIAIGSDWAFVLEPSRTLAADDNLMLDLEHERDLMSISQRMIGEFRKDLVVGGLGVFTPAYRVKLEEKQQELSASRERLRSQLAAISPRLVISSA